MTACEIITSIFILFTAIVCGWCWFMTKRATWVLRKRINFIEVCDKNIRRYEKENLHGLVSVSEIMEKCLLSHEKCIMLFWIWDFEKMVIDQELYNKYYKPE